MKNRVLNERGGVMIEFALVIPLFVLLVSGFIQFGRVLTEMSMASQNAYEVARRGAETPSDQGTVSLDQFGDKLTDNWSRYLNTVPTDQVKTSHLGGGVGVPPSQVVVEVEADLRKVGHFGHRFTNEFKTEIAAPYLLKRSGFSINYSTPQNP